MTMINFSSVIQQRHLLLCYLRATARLLLLCNLTTKLSRAAAGREAHGKLFLPCGLRHDVASA